MARVKLKTHEEGKEDKKQVALPDVTFHAQLEVKQDQTDKANDSDGLFIEGFASTSDIDRVSDIVDPSAFKKTLSTFMKNPVVMLNHGGGMFGGREAIGKIVESEIKPKGLWVKALISSAPSEESLRVKIREKIYSAFSFGFKILNSEMIKKAGQEIRKITDLELLEVSVVSIPANRHALFSVAKAFEFGTDLVYKNEFVEKDVASINATVKELTNRVSKLDSNIDLDELCKQAVEEVKRNFIKSEDAEGKVFDEAIKKMLEQENEEKAENLIDSEASKDAKEDIKGNGPILEKLNLLEEEIQTIKAGRVLSSSNRTTLEKAMSSMQDAMDSLDAILKIGIATDDASDADNENIDERDIDIEGEKDLEDVIEFTPDFDIDKDVENNDLKKDQDEAAVNAAIDTVWKALDTLNAN